jgi:diketogulonate reductase-like aldo/keto reductase
MNRRTFVGSLVAAAPTLAYPLMSQPARPVLTRAIPSTGERLPAIGLGTWQTFDVGDDVARRAQCAETLSAFMGAGGTVIDSSPMYGTSERVVGDLVQSARAREKLWIATKVWTTGEGAGVTQMNESMEKLKVPRLDLMQIHNLVDWQVHLRTLRAWKDAGRVRYIGVTHYQAGAHDQVARILRAEPVDFVQLNLSLDEPQAVSLFGLCAERGVAFIANRPFGGGQSFGRARGKALPGWASEYAISSWAQFMLTWILSHPEVTCAIPGTSRAAHAVDNLGAARGDLPDTRGRQRMEAAWRAL